MSIRDKLISGPLGFGSAPMGNMLRELCDGMRSSGRWRAGSSPGTRATSSFRSRRRTTP
jgi:hypothetical protein